MAQKFYDLELPQNDSTKKWFVRVARVDLSYYLLNDANHEIADLDKTPVDRFYFDTEFDAHHYACVYYTYHNKPYPYFTEFSQSMTISSFTTPTAKKFVVDDGSSQQMTFD